MADSKMIDTTSSQNIDETTRYFDSDKWFNKWLFPFEATFFLILATFMLLAKKIRAKIQRTTKNEDLLNLIPCQESLFYSFIFYLMPLQIFTDGDELPEIILSVVSLSYAIKQTIKVSE